VIAAIVVDDSPAILVGLALAWLAAGAVAVGQQRPNTLLGAIAVTVAWPFMLVGDAPKATGPFAAEIEDALERLRLVIADVGFDPAWAGDLNALASALRRADARLAVVDRILADAPVQAEVVTTLRARRDRAATALASALDELVTLRVRIGMQALCGDTVPLRDQLADLTARQAAWDELLPTEDLG
jgi:hypothetical protein